MTFYPEVNPALLLEGERGLGLMASPLHNPDSLGAYLGPNASETFMDENGDDILVPSLVLWSAVPQTASGLAQHDLEKEEVIKPPLVRIEYVNGLQPSTWWRNAVANSVDSLVLQRKLLGDHQVCGPLYHRDRMMSSNPWRCVKDNPLCEDMRGFIRDAWIVPAHIVRPVHNHVGQQLNSLINADHMMDLAIGANNPPEISVGGDCPCAEEEHLQECEIISEAGHCACCPNGKGLDIMIDVMTDNWHPTQEWPEPLQRAWQRLVDNTKRGWDRWRGASNEGQALDWPIWYAQSLFASQRDFDEYTAAEQERRKAWQLSSPLWRQLWP